MIYTYQISFNGADYVSLYPTLPVEMSGEWVQDTFIWRESIKELKINKDLNSTIYETLKAYFIDNTKFETRIWVKILKNNVQESLHWFGIKWGEIDYDNCYYKVEPKPYDLYGQYLENNMEGKKYGAVKNAYVDIYDYSGADFVYEDVIGSFSGVPELAEYLSDTIKERIYENSGIATADIKSTLMWGDDDEDGVPATVTNGMLIDYITGTYSKLKYACFASDMKSWWDLTIKDCFEILRIFQIYPYFDKNNKLRFEHISYIIDRLENDAISITINTHDEKLEYNIQELPVTETITMYDDETSDSDYFDFYGKPIIYSYIRNRIDAINIQTNFDIYTNVYNYVIDKSLMQKIKILVAAYSNYAMNWVNVDIGTYSNTDHTFNIQHSTGQFCKTKSFKSHPNFTLTVIGTVSGNMKFGIYKTSDDSLISNEVTVSGSPGSGTLTLTENPENCYLRVTSDNVAGTFTGYVLLEELAGIYVNNMNHAGILASGLPNGDFSLAAIHDNYWKDYRLSRSGNMNGSAETFSSTKYNLIRKSIKAYFATIPNPLAGMDDETRIGKIENWTRYLETGYIEMQINYQED